MLRQVFLPVALLLCLAGKRCKGAMPCAVPHGGGVRRRAFQALRHPVSDAYGGEHVFFECSDQSHIVRTDSSHLLGDDRGADTQHHGVLRAGRRADASVRRNHCFPVLPAGQAASFGLSPQVSFFRPSHGESVFHLLLPVHVSFRRRQQTVEVGMINYTWPCLVVLFAILFNGQKARWWIVPGVIISFAGIMLVLGGEKGIDLPGIWRHMQGNPWSYLLAFCGAVAWAAYSNLTPRLVGRAESHAYCFCAGFSDFCFIVDCWIRRSFSRHVHGLDQRRRRGRGHGRFLCPRSYGVTKGNITILAVASYFTPVLSCLFATVWIGASSGRIVLERRGRGRAGLAHVLGLHVFSALEPLSKSEARGAAQSSDVLERKFRAACAGAGGSPSLYELRVLTCPFREEKVSAMRHNSGNCVGVVSCACRNMPRRTRIQD